MLEICKKQKFFGKKCSENKLVTLKVLNVIESTSELSRKTGLVDGSASSTADLKTVMNEAKFDIYDQFFLNRQELSTKGQRVFQHNNLLLHRLEFLLQFQASFLLKRVSLSISSLFSI